MFVYINVVLYTSMLCLCISMSCCIHQCYRMLLKRGMGNGEWGMGNGEWGMGNGEWGMENGEWGMGNEK